MTALLVASCGSTSPSPTPSSSPAPIPPPRATSGEPSPGASAPAGSVATAVVADPTLLDLLKPAAVGLHLTYDPDTTASVMADPSLAGDVAALAIGLATPTGQASPQDFVIANVARLRDPSRDQEWFRSWRDTYDQAACDRAGGVQGNAQATIGGQTVFIGSCVNGALTYHARLQNGAIVLSLTSVGPGRLGERLLRATLSP